MSKLQHRSSVEQSPAAWRANLVPLVAGTVQGGLPPDFADVPIRPPLSKNGSQLTVRYSATGTLVLVETAVE